MFFTVLLARELSRPVYFAVLLAPVFFGFWDFKTPVFLPLRPRRVKSPWEIDPATGKERKITDRHMCSRFSKLYDITVSLMSRRMNAQFGMRKIMVRVAVAVAPLVGSVEPCAFGPPLVGPVLGCEARRGKHGKKRNTEPKYGA